MSTAITREYSSTIFLDNSDLPDPLVPNNAMMTFSFGIFGAFEGDSRSQPWIVNECVNVRDSLADLRGFIESPHRHHERDFGSKLPKVRQPLGEHRRQRFPELLRLVGSERAVPGEGSRHAPHYGTEEPCPLYIRFGDFGDFAFVRLRTLRCSNRALCAFSRAPGFLCWTGFTRAAVLDEFDCPTEVRLCRIVNNGRIT